MTKIFGISDCVVMTSEMKSIFRSFPIPGCPISRRALDTTYVVKDVKYLPNSQEVLLDTEEGSLEGLWLSSDLFDRAL